MTDETYQRQISGVDADGRYVLAGIVNRTYALDKRGALVLAPAATAQPLREEPLFDDNVLGLMLDDTDLYAAKPQTDVVVEGYACAARPCAQFTAKVAVGGTVKRILVSGPRRCEPGRRGLRLSSAQPVERVQLSYVNAYGGHDALAEQRRGNHLAELAKYMPLHDLRMASPFVYPRNPAGVGYSLESDAAALEQLRLPQLEDPDDPLTAERLVCPAPERWSAMPLPWSTGFVHLGVFPRSAWIGLVPDLDPATLPLLEVARGYCSPELLTPGLTLPRFDMRVASGASLGLQLPYVQPGTEVVLSNLHPMQPELRFELPPELPKIQVDGRNGKLLETQTVIQTIRIYPSLQRVVLTFRGSAQALRPYAAEELQHMPFEVGW